MTAPAEPRMRDGLIKRGDSWYFVLDQPRDPATGKRRQKWVKGGRTRKEAESARDEARDRKGNRGGWKAPSRLLLGEYLVGTWLPSVKAKVAPSTFTSYRQNLTHVVNRIGHVRLDALDPPTLDALYADLEAGGLARSTVRLLHTQLHRALADAVRWDLLARNPSDLVDPPKPTRRVLTTWTADQLRTFLHGMAGDHLAALYQLAAASGMRIGELVRLEWPDVHLDGGYLTVRRSKTATGRRRVELDPATIAVLRAHRKRQAAERLAFGVGYRGHGRVFTRPGGEPLNPDAVSIQFKRRAAASACRRSGSTISAMAGRRWRWRPASIPGGGRAARPRLGAGDAGHLQPRDAGRAAGSGHQGGQPLPGPCCSRLLADEPAAGPGGQETGS
jgi:integrase